MLNSVESFKILNPVEIIEIGQFISKTIEELQESINQILINLMP